MSALINGSRQPQRMLLAGAQRAPGFLVVGLHWESGQFGRFLVRGKSARGSGLWPCHSEMGSGPNFEIGARSLKWLHLLR